MRRRQLAWWGGAVVLSALAACGPAGARPLTGSGMDMFEPVAMRIHPLTRAIPNNPKENVEIHLELKDQFGDVAKGVGKVSLELYSYALMGLNHHGKKLATWSGDLSTPEFNKQYWDPITRTYVFHFQADPARLKVGSKWVVAATMELPNNLKLTDDFTMEVK